MSYGKEIFRGKYKETMDSLNIIKGNYYDLDQEYQWSMKEKNEEIERLYSIIKEVREYIKETHYYSEVINEEYLLKSELERILDKENKE